LLLLLLLDDKNQYEIKFNLSISPNSVITKALAGIVVRIKIFIVRPFELIYNFDPL